MSFVEYNEVGACVERWFDNYMKHCTNFDAAIDNLTKQGKVLTKNKSISCKARDAGNELFNANDKHDSHTHKNILYEFSKSIAFAPNSEELAIGYSSRSILLMHMKLYKESLIDIDRALELSTFNALKTQLQARKNECLHWLNVQILEDSTKTVKLNNDKNKESFISNPTIIEPSAVLPHASNSVELACNETFGRHLVAARDIKPGEILIIEECHVCYPREDLLYVLCSHCLQIAWNGIPCNDCAFTMYCSEACKNQAFEEYHDVECYMMKYMGSFADDLCKRTAALRIFIKAIKEEGLASMVYEYDIEPEEKNLEAILSDEILRSDKFRTYYNLLSQAQDIDPMDDPDEYEAFILYMLMKHPTLLPHRQDNSFHPTVLENVIDIISKLRQVVFKRAHMYQAQVDCECPTIDHCKMKCNSSRGCFLSSTCSFLNHSCLPNVCRIYVPKRKVIVFATCSIKKGDQLYDSYGLSCIHDLKNRQDVLKNSFDFTCTCAACRDNLQLERTNEEVTRDWSMIVHTYENNTSKEIYKPFFHGPLDACAMTEELLQLVIQISDSCFENMDFYSGYVCNLRCKTYIEMFYLKHYGEKLIITSD